MNVIVNSQVLASELRLLKNVVPTKPAIQILSHALLRAEGDSLSLYATDLEIGFSTHCAAQVIAAGEVALPVARFLSLVEQFPDADVSIALDKNRVSVRCGAFKSMLQSMTAKDFPQPPDASGDVVRIDAADLHRLIERTRSAINASQSKHILRGALLSVAGSVAAMVATDGKRLSIATVAVANGQPQVSIIVPAKALDVLASQVVDADVEVTAGRQLAFAAGTRVITSRMIDGQFPAYERMIPTGNDNVVTVDRSALTAALKRVRVAAEENKAIYFAIAPQTLELSSASAEVGTASEAVAIDYVGSPLRVCINGDYVLDFLGAASLNAITLAFKDANGAALLSDGDDHVCVIMLMRS